MVSRQRVWIDGQVQGVLVGRVVLYWSGILIYFGLSIGFYQYRQNPDWTMAEHLQAMFDQLWPCLPTVLLLPLVIFDIVRLSNRFVGPVYRLRMHLARLRENSDTYPLNFRDDDYWQQLAEPINELQQRILTLEQQVRTLTAFNQEPVPTPEAMQAQASEPTERSPRDLEKLTELFPGRGGDPFVKAGV
ncbi:MAG: hypothetical protein ACTHK7_08495 [Aureliella sp.]